MAGRPGCEPNDRAFELMAAIHEATTRPVYEYQRDGYTRLVDVGGYANSHHGVTAARLFTRGYLTRVRAGGGVFRALWMYRLTDEGLAELRKWKARQRRKQARQQALKQIERRI